MGNFGLNEGVPWISASNGFLGFICEIGVETVVVLFLDYTFLDQFGIRLVNKICYANLVDGVQIPEFITNLDYPWKVLLLLGRLGDLPFHLTARKAAKL